MATAINIEEDACNDSADRNNEPRPDFGVLVDPGGSE